MARKKMLEGENGTYHIELNSDNSYNVLDEEENTLIFACHRPLQTAEGQKELIDICDSIVYELFHSDFDGWTVSYDTFAIHDNGILHLWLKANYPLYANVMGSDEEGFVIQAPDTETDILTILNHLPALDDKREQMQMDLEAAIDEEKEYCHMVRIESRYW